MSLILYQFEACPYCAKVRAAIKELAVELEVRDTRENDNYREELLAMTGKTQVPCLLIDGKPMHESDDIVAYLKENF
ncbi:MAG: glutathione S-transferase N-terminal domain-containing protein [Proteobacteria bacterium]|nr:glutathione S-transferase N-terminal domain-containing protein [Pseudomonadota bacterium]